ncbi:MAG: glycoside hydrolase family 15 protein [Desulfobacteraceae bacterium]
MVYRSRESRLQVDGTCDASLWGLFAFGLYAAQDHRLVATMTALQDKLWVKTDIGGMARYEDDPYHRVSPNLPGNPWFICTLWLADYLVEKSDDAEGLDQALHLLSWVADQALPSGVLAEQINPLTGEPLSVSPLTWSHATYIATIHRLLRRLLQEPGYPEAGAVFTPYGRREDWIEKLYAQTCDSIHGICKL